MVFLCKKAFDNHKRINYLENQIEKLQQGEGGYKKEVDNFTVGDETVVRRGKKKNEDSTIDVRELSTGGDNPSEHDTHSQEHDSSIDSTVTILCQKEIMHVHNHVNPGPEVVAIAQKHHKEKTKSNYYLGIDEMDITFNTKDKEMMTNSSRRQTIYEGRPTSMLLHLSSPTPDTQGLSEEGIFVHKTLTKSGGVLELLGIKLVVPNGALTEDTQITLGVTWCCSVYPKLLKSSAILSPVVVCQPSIVFRKPVHLSFPHCAINHERDWTFTLLHRPNDIHHDASEWTELPLTDTNKLQIGEHRVSLELKHFTLYTLTGQSVEGQKAVKAVKLLAFTSPFQIDKMFTVRIYCINNYEEDSPEMKSIKATEAELKEKMADSLQPMFVHDNGEDITVNMSNVTNGWDIDGEMIQNIDFESIWHCLSPSCKFLFHPSDNKLRKIICNFNYYQKPSQKIRTMKIAEEQIQFSCIALRENLTPELQLMKKMVVLLDPKSDNDSRLLAEKIGYDYSEIKWLETQQSPTETILEKWISDGKCLSDLKTYLLEMGRLDVVSLFEDDTIRASGSNA